MLSPALETAARDVALVGAIFLYMAVSALACARVAARKNRGADEWFVCGELFGLIALAAVLLLPALRSSASEIDVVRAQRPQSGTIDAGGAP